VDYVSKVAFLEKIEIITWGKYIFV
jgi:hypothetical protein